MLREDVLRKKTDFDAVYSKGRSTGSRYVVIFYLKNDLGLTRTCFLASKKVGNSVMRNRARRLMKESFRQIKGRLPEGYDLIFIARTTIQGRVCSEVKRSMVDALKRAKLIA